MCSQRHWDNMHKRWIKDGLSEYLQEGHAVWHMPGHKRKACYGDFQDAFLAWDVTEVPGTDDLYLPDGFIGQSLAMLKEIYQTCGTYYVVNGATGGIFTAIAACTKPGDTILIAKNCHKSVYNAATVMQRQMVYVEPVWKNMDESACTFTEFIDGYIDADDVEKICKSHPEIKAVVVTSPTYEGVISDIAGIARVAHAHHVRVIVDEAHGAHLPFLKPEYSAIRMGADVVVQSLHKTLPAMTQTAVIHVCTEDLVKPVEQALEVFLSSSPSYIFMLNMESAICYMADHRFTDYANNLHEFINSCGTLEKQSHIPILKKEEVLAAGAYGYDETRLVFYAPVPGPELLQMLSEQGNIVCEMAGRKHVVLISTVQDTKEDFDKLYGTIQKLGDVLKGEASLDKALYDRHTELVRLTGTRAKEPVYVYPPGSYIVNTGEIFTAEIVEKLCTYQDAGLHIRGIHE